MLFSKNESLNIFSCNVCKNRGKIGVGKCPECHGMSMGMLARGNWLYFSVEFTRYHIDVRHMRRLLKVFEIIGAMIFSAGFLVFSIWRFMTVEADIMMTDPEFWQLAHMTRNIGFTMFWVGFLSLTYLFYLVLESKKSYQSVEKDENFIEKTNYLDDYSPIDVRQGWSQFNKMSHKQKIDISESFTDEAILVLEKSFRVAEKYKSKTVTPLHVFHSLLGLDTVKGVFLRLGMPASKVQAKIGQMFQKEDIEVEPVLSPEIDQIIFHAYENAYRSKQEYVHSIELIVATVNQSEVIQELLYDLGIDAQKMANVVAWVKVRELLRDQYRIFRQAASRVSKHGMDRAMTAVATPYLNRFSQDLTLAAKFGYLAPCIARDKEIEQILRIIEGGRQSVILVGDHGVGKMTIIEGVTQRMIQGRVPDRLKDKRLVQISTSALVAGVSLTGAQERMIRMMNEIHKAGNIILFINNIHDLFSLSSQEGQETLDLSETLTEFLSSGNVITFSTTTVDGYNRFIMSSHLGSILSKIDVKEMNEDQAIQALESNIGLIEYKNNVFFSYDALSKAVQLATRLLHDQPLPESAMGLASETATYVKNKKKDNIIVRGEDVAQIVSNKTGVPATNITENESDKLMRLEEEMHKRVVGQNEAVSLVANALRRARAEIRSTSRPIANFLFLGPTGVGKTELAKTIADVYFGGENRMIRIDMSEFQDKAGVYRLIGQPGKKGTGLLTEAVRRQPFSLVLLDEMEKADPDILNLFLQVFDDGRLTDSVGRLIDFTNTIIISTSNAGTSYVQDRLREGQTVEQIREEFIRGELKKYYRPEFLNRFDGIVMFRSLMREEIKMIAKLMLKRVAKDLEQRGVELRVEDAALEALAVAGFDPEFGARPMRRVIQERVENKLAELILSGKLQRRDVVVLGEGASLFVKTL